MKSLKYQEEFKILTLKKLSETKESWKPTQIRKRIQDMNEKGTKEITIKNRTSRSENFIKGMTKYSWKL